MSADPELMRRLNRERYTPIPPAATKQELAEDALAQIIRLLARALEDDRKAAA